MNDRKIQGTALLGRSANQNDVVLLLEGRTFASHDKGERTGIKKTASHARF